MKKNKCQPNNQIFEPVSEYHEQIIKDSGSNINLCYQCHKCSSGCPFIYFMDDSPSLIIHAIKIGMREKVETSNTIWICSACYACSTRCPQKVDVAGIMSEARNMAINNDRMPDERIISDFYNVFLQNIFLFGRVYEPALIGMLKLKTGRFTEDIEMGIKMLIKGKMRILPNIPGNIGQIRRIIRESSKDEKEI